MKQLPDKAYYTITELAKHFSISKSSLYLKIERKELKAIKPAGLRIPFDEVEKLKKEVCCDE